MNNNEKIVIDEKDIVLIVDGEEYYKIDDYYSNPKDLEIPIVNKIKNNANIIKKLLYSWPAFINMIKSSIPNEVYQAALTNEEKIKLANGTIELMSSKDGNLLACMINSKTKKIVSNIKLEKVKLSPELNKALINYNAQVQIAKIAEDIQHVQMAIEEVRKGQENDRLAIAYSCKQKLLQAITIEDSNLRQFALINLAASAEDSRNKLILSQIENVEFLKKQPKGFWGKLTKGAKEEEKDRRITELRESMNALNMISLTEAIAYQELGEQTAANISLQYYSDYINTTYLSNMKFIERLDSLNPSPKKYWSTILPNICKEIEKLNSGEEKKLLEEIKNEEEN